MLAKRTYYPAGQLPSWAAGAWDWVTWWYPCTCAISPPSRPCPRNGSIWSCAGTRVHEPISYHLPCASGRTCHSHLAEKVQNCPSTMGGNVHPPPDHNRSYAIVILSTHIWVDSSELWIFEQLFREEKKQPQVESRVYRCLCVCVKMSNPPSQTACYYFIYVCIQLLSVFLLDKLNTGIYFQGGT